LINDIDNTEEGCEKFRSDIIEFLEQSNQGSEEVFNEPVLSPKQSNIRMERCIFEIQNKKKGKVLH
jgi:hypothetical protein